MKHNNDLCVGFLNECGTYLHVCDFQCSSTVFGKASAVYVGDVVYWINLRVV